MNRTYLLEKENMLNALLKLSIPSAVALFANVFYNIVDTIFIGRYIGTIGLESVSIYLPIQKIIIAFTILIGMGTATLISKSFGEKDHKKANYLFGNLLFIVLIIAVFSSVLVFIFARPILFLFGADTVSISLAVEYARSMFFSLLFLSITFPLNATVRAEGNAKYSMYALLIGMSTNILFCYIFIAVFKMGISGAGYATSLAEFCSFLYFVYYFKFKSSLKISLKYLKFNKEYTFKAVPIGSSSFIGRGSASIVTILMNHLLLIYGSNFDISAYSIVSKITGLIRVPLSGISNGMKPIVSYNLGAKNFNRIKEALKISLILSFIMALLMTLGGIFFPHYIFSIFTNNETLINISSNFLKIIIMARPFTGIYIVIIGFYQSLGQAKKSFRLSLFRRFLIFIPVAILLPHLFNIGMLGIFLAFPISDFVSFLVATIMISRDYKRIFKDR